MDPVTQALAGSLVAQAAARGRNLRPAASVGAVAGLVPDLDVLIRSSGDSLLAIEYHRHFSHSFVFVPIIGIAVGLLAWPAMRRLRPDLPFALLVLWATLGALSHGVLDAATSYGTRLLWPFSDERVAWNLISVIDPLFTVPIAALLMLALWRQQVAWVRAAVLWSGLYLAFAGVQQGRAEAQLLDWTERTGVEVQRMVVKPSFANLVLWRGLVDDGERFHALAVRVLPGRGAEVWNGASVQPYRPEGLKPGSRLASDLARFRHFSSGWDFHYPPWAGDAHRFIGDFRYAIDPAGARPLWGILVNPADSARPVEFQRRSQVPDAERQRFFERLTGRVESSPPS